MSIPFRLFQRPELRTRPVVLLCLALLVAAVPASGAESMVIATKTAPPFVIEREDGTLGGITIELWERIAARLDREYRYDRTELAALIDGTASGHYALGAGALTITAERERAIDFSHPFYATGYGIAVPAEGPGPVVALLGRLFSLEFLEALLALFALLAVVGGVLWLFERRRNAAQFGGSTAEGLGAGLWWAAVTMTTVGYGDKAPVTLGGRVIATVWMFAAIIVISSFTAAIATALTVDSLGGKVRGIDDLPRAAVGTVGGTSSAAWLADQRVRGRDYADLRAALADLAAGRLDAVVYDAPLLRYVAASEFEDAVRVLKGTFDRQDYGFALPPGSALREPLNRAMLEVLADPAWADVLASYLGDG